MKNLLKKILVGGFFILAIASPTMAITSPQTVSAATDNCEARVLGIPPWYRGLTNNNPPTCDLKSPDDVGGLSAFIWRLVLNIIEMAIVLVAYIAIFFLIYGGFLFMTGGANPSQIENARKTITNAIIGLVIAMAAIAINNLIFSIIT